MQKKNHLYGLSDKQKKNKAKNKNELTFSKYAAFILIFVLIIPWILFKLKWFFLLLAYLPNLDLIATVLSYSKLPWFNHLYNLKTENKRQEYSQISINYMALLGLIYVVIKETKLTNEIHSGWSLAIVMLLITYLLPGDLIVWILGTTDKYVKKFTKGKNKDLERSVDLIVGFLTVACIIGFEAFILEKYRKQLASLAKVILVHIPNFLNGDNH